MMRIFFALGMLTFLFISCSDEENKIEGIIVETISSENINEGGVLLKGQIENINEVVDLGFVLSNFEGDTYFEKGQVKYIEGVGEGEYSIKFREGLKEGRKYYYNVFCEINGEYFYGKEKLFVSNGSALPIVKEVVPNKACLLDTILIRGTFFSKRPRVFFSNTESVPIQASDSIIKVVVPLPKGSTIATPYKNVKVINLDEQETISSGFSLHTPRIDSIIPRRIIDSDTLNVYGDYFETAKISNRVTTEHDGVVYNYTVLESSRNRIVLKPMKIFEKKPKLKLKSQLTEVVKEVEVAMPVVTGVSKTCASFGEDIVIRGANFPVNNRRAVVKFGDNYLFSQIETRDSLVVKLSEGLQYEDFYNNELLITYLREQVSVSNKMCINEPWIRMRGINGIYNVSHVLKKHMYKGEYYFLTGGYYGNYERKLLKLNESNMTFEEIEKINFERGTIGFSGFHGAKFYYLDLLDNGWLFKSKDFETGEEEELTKFPGRGRFDGFMVSIGDYIYAGLGISYPDIPEKDIWRYSTVNNSWENVTDNFPEISSYDEAKKAPIVFAVGSNIYIGSGQPNDQRKFDLWELNTNTNIITPKSNLPVISSTQDSFIIGEKVYFQNEKLYEYDITNDMWNEYITNGMGYAYEGYLKLQDNIYMLHAGDLYKFNPEYLK